MSSNHYTLDVREDLGRGREPFSKIMTAVAQLRPDQGLRLIAPFEPTPLFGVLKARGFKHTSRECDDGSFEILFDREAVVQPVAPVCELNRLEVDARGLEPPEPMVRILEALAVLPEGAELVARTDRRPIHLRPRLAEQGFADTSETQPDGSWVTIIRRAG